MIRIGTRITIVIRTHAYQKLVFRTRGSEVPCEPEELVVEVEFPFVLDVLGPRLDVVSVDELEVVIVLEVTVPGRLEVVEELLNVFVLCVLVTVVTFGETAR